MFWGSSTTKYINRWGLILDNRFKKTKKVLRMSFKVSVNEDECIGCGACAAVCDNFDMDGDKAKVKQPDVDDIGTNQEAADACPKACIIVEEQ
jgi:ferredoxin